MLAYEGNAYQLWSRLMCIEALVRVAVSGLEHLSVMEVTVHMILSKPFQAKGTTMAQ